jgi:hypothetical protein
MQGMSPRIELSISNSRENARQGEVIIAQSHGIFPGLPQSDTACFYAAQIVSERPARVALRKLLAVSDGALSRCSVLRSKFWSRGPNGDQRRAGAAR